ncbi:MAG: UbiD family decarboxylase, partial [Alphaproteobacteria bacterium]|nr:UbiD family decarboxylase [Alphaproteobacteria bacterium]
MTKIDKDLRGYLDRMRASGALLTVDKQVDPYTEAPSLLRSAVKRGKALMFRNVGGSAIPA